MSGNSLLNAARAGALSGDVGPGVLSDLNAADLAAVEARLKELGDNAVRTIVWNAANLAMRPVLADARNRCPERTGLLRRSLSLRTNNKRGTVFSVVRVQSTVRDAKNWPAKYAHLVEFGTEPHEEKLSTPVLMNSGWVDGILHHPGAAPKPFLRPALAANREAVLASYRASVLRGIEVEAARLAAKGARR